MYIHCTKKRFCEITECLKILQNIFSFFIGISYFAKVQMAEFCKPYQILIWKGDLVDGEGGKGGIRRGGGLRVYIDL